MYRRPGRTGWWASFSDAEKHISLKSDDETQAARTFAALLERRRIRQLAPGEVPLVEIFAEVRTRAETENTPKTAYELHLNLRRILSWLEARGIFGASQVTQQVVADYKSERRLSVSTRGENKIGAARVNRELDSWRRAWRVAIEKRCALAEDLGMFGRLREPRPEPHKTVASKAQLDRMVRKAALPYRHLFRAVLGCGLRDEEMRHLEAGDVGRREVRVAVKADWQPKSYRARTVPISSATRAALLAWVKARDEGAVMDKKWVWKQAKRACDAAKVPMASLHQLRHAYASHAYRQGVPLKTISAWLGHRDVATTERYIGVVETGVPAGVKLPW